MGEIMNGDFSHRHQSKNLNCAYDRISALILQCDANVGIEQIESFLRENPGHAEAHNDLAVLYYRTGNKLQTLGHYEKAVRLAPTNASFRKNLASFYFVEMGWTDDAILIYADILKSYPADTEALASLGLISSAVGRPDEARIFFRRVLELEPWNNEARQALESVDRSKTEPLYTPVKESPIIAKTSQKSDMENMLAGLRETISKLENESTTDSHEMACNLAAAGKVEEAVVMLERLLEKNPRDGLAHNDLGVLYAQLGNTEKSIEHHEFALAISPRNSTFRKNLASLYYAAAGRTDDAIILYTDLLKENPGDVETLEALAVISISKNRPEEAAIFLRKLVEIDPANGHARSLLFELDSNSKQGFFLAAR